MISGGVVQNEGRIRLTARGPTGREQEVEVALDTSYTSSLTLPSALIAELGLRWRSVDRLTLADGSTCFVRVYRATVIWDREELPILVDASDSIPLLGMKLLSGYELKMQVRNGGSLTIKKLSRR
jgi:clan AA aspartic protease